MVKKLSASAAKRCGFDIWVRKVSWRRAQQPTSVFLPGESGKRTLDRGPWWATVHRIAQSDTAELT